MLTKEEKLKYGQQLRRQMQEKQQQKRMMLDLKRGVQKQRVQNTNAPVPPGYNNRFYQNPKQSLQQRNEAQQYANYNQQGPPRMPQLKTENNQNIRKQYPPEQYQQYNNSGYHKHQGQGAINEYPQGNPYEQINNKTNVYELKHQQAPYNSPYGNVNYPQGQNNQYPPQYDQGYNRQGNYRNEYSDRQNQKPNGYPHQYEAYENPRNHPEYLHQDNYQNQYDQHEASHGRLEPHGFQQPIQEIKEKHNAFRQKTLQNEQLMEIHKKGGRNLLQLENMSIDQQQIKQKQKQEMRKQLELQMKEAEQRKQKQIERIKRQQLEQQRKNQQYLLQQKRKLEDEQRKKNQKQRQLQQQNARNLEQRRRLEEEAKEKARRQKYGRNENVQNVVNTPKIKGKEDFSRQAQMKIQADQTFSDNSSQTVIESAFKTDVSREFFEKQRRKNQEKYNREKNLQAVTDEISRLKEQIDRQNQLFKKQIQKIKLESQMADNQKQKAQQQIERLKDQLKQKMEDDNARLFKALQRQSQIKNEEDDYPQFKKSSKNNNVEILRPPKQSEPIITKKYSVPRRQQFEEDQLEQSNVSGQGLVSLRGQSKKIPLNLPNEKLSMSQLSQFARETQYFKNGNQGDGMKKKIGLNAHDSIVEQDQERQQSRNQNRNVKNPQRKKDSLDQMMESRQKSRGGWGQLSSVNSDITKQIEDLLKKKDKHNNNNNYDLNSNYNYKPDYSPDIGFDSKNSRPSSNLSNAGRRAVSKHGYEYEGASLNSINSGTNGGLNSVDIDQINNRNEARLDQFRKLGVQTINTNNDGQLTKLDEILNRYKEGKSRIHI